MFHPAVFCPIPQSNTKKKAMTPYVDDQLIKKKVCMNSNPNLWFIVSPIKMIYLMLFWVPISNRPMFSALVRS